MDICRTQSNSIYNNLHKLPTAAAAAAVGVG
jgi:hypothetical protein